MLTTEQTALIEKYFDRCRFDDECNFCNDPQLGSYAQMSYSEDLVDFYVCGKCAVAKAQAIEDDNNKLEKFCDGIDRITKLAEDLNLAVRMNSDDGWDYWENGVWIGLGKNNEIAEANLLEWNKKVR